MTPLAAFAAHRWGRFRDRAAVAAHQERLLARLRRDVLPRVPFYAGHLETPLDALPPMNREAALAAFDALGTTRLTRAEAEAMARAAEPGAAPAPPRKDGLAAGFSTGTSGGPRGLFVTSRTERRLWAAALAGRFWPRPPWRAPRIALFLRADNQLYDALNIGPLRLRFFDASAPAGDHAAALARLDPTVLAGPPSALLRLAQAGLTLRPNLVLLGAEPAEPQDLDQLAAAFGPRPHSIYQCTEGVLAMSCPAGRLHLNERHVHFRREIIDRASGAFVPIISDLTRDSMMVLNYRLDDVLVPDPRPCPCGCASVVIARIEGRLADAVFLTDAAGRRIWISAERLRASALALPGVRDWALTVADGAWRLFLDAPAPVPASTAEAAFAALARAHGCPPPRIELIHGLPPQSGPKRRRVRVIQG